MALAATIVKGFAYLLGYDEVVTATIVENRGLMVILLGLSVIVFAMFHHLDTSE